MVRESENEASNIALSVMHGGILKCRVRCVIMCIHALSILVV